jgi:hypothetical protein
METEGQAWTQLKKTGQLWKLVLDQGPMLEFLNTQNRRTMTHKKSIEF